MDAIEEAGLSKQAVVNGQTDLSRLNNNKKVSLLDFIGLDVDRTDTFNSLFSTALKLRGANIKDMDKLSAPRGSIFPIVGTDELFIRKSYKELHDTILETFENAHARNAIQKHIVVTGTSGIGKSAFLVYFAIRLLAESDDDNPPMIVFHTKRSEKCYVFGGRSTVRSGSFKDFEPFLSLPDTWYLVDSSSDPVLDRAKTIISASLNTLFSEAHQYQEVDKCLQRLVPVLGVADRSNYMLSKRQGPGNRSSRCDYGKKDNVKRGERVLDRRSYQMRVG